MTRHAEDTWRLFTRMVVLCRRRGLSVQDAITATRTMRKMEQGCYDQWGHIGLWTVDEQVGAQRAANRRQKARAKEREARRR